MNTGKFNLNDLMKNAQGIMEEAQGKLNKITVKGEAGAGLVSIVINAKHEVLAFTLADEILKESKDVIEDLIRAAISDANHKIAKETQENMLALKNFFPKESNEE